MIDIDVDLLSITYSNTLFFFFCRISCNHFSREQINIPFFSLQDSPGALENESISDEQRICSGGYVAFCLSINALLPRLSAPENQPHC